MFRPLLLIAIAAGLALFTWSNLQPIALTVLGLQTPAFPLALWVLGALLAGVMTTVCISILFSLSSYATGRAVRSEFRQSPRSRFERLRRDHPQSTSSTRASEDTSDAAWKNWDGYEEPADYKQAPAQPAAARSDEDDWEADTSDDWEADAPSDRHRADTGSSRRPYDTSQTSSTSRSSSYSYGYRDPGKSGVGRQEKVVDAEYRVIIPPYQPVIVPPVNPPAAPPPKAPPENEENADDWFEEGDKGAGR